jgi:DNA-binding GntR family transcriptional regulator
MQSPSPRSGALEPPLEDDVAPIGAGDDGFTTVAQRTYDLLRQALLNGEFLPGQSISLRSAADALGISQMPVRQALSRLQAEGILVMHENRTLTVPKMTPALILETRDIRIALEGLAAELAAHRATAQDVAELKARFGQMQQAVHSTDVRRYIAVNLKFHMGIYGAAGAPTLLSMIETLWAKFAAYSRWANTELAMGTLNNHARALEGMARRDAIMVRSAIVQDCCDSCEIQLRLLAEHQSEDTGDGGSAISPDAANREPVKGSLGSLVAPRRRGRPRKLTA